jgi:acetyl esterase/lipase
VPLDPAAKRLLDIIASGGGMGDISRLTPEEMRQVFRRFAQSVDIKDAPIGEVRDGEWPGPGGALPYRLYFPSHPADWPAPALIFFRGGGCIFGSIDTHDGLCRVLATQSGCAVVSVGYRQAPEHKFPAAVEDSWAAIRWFAAHASALSLDPARLAIGGDSAGGALAAAACQMAARNKGPRLALQVLFCPVMDVKADTPSRRDFAEGYFLTHATMDWMLSHYCQPGTDLNDPRLSPLRAADFSGLPSAHIHTAEFDPLRDEGEVYALALRRGGVAVSYTCHAGMIHHFYGMAGVIPAARAALKAAALAMREALVGAGAAFHSFSPAQVGNIRLGPRY